LNKSKWFLLPIALLIVLAITLAGCNQTTSTTPTTPSSTTPSTSTPSTPTKPSTPTTPTTPSTPANPGELSGEITEAGSTTVQPLAESLAAVFMNKYPEIKVTIQGGGSSVGVKSAAEGTVDIGAASRELKSSEIGTVVPHVLARDGIAIVTHPSQTISNLTKDQVKQIFSGAITNWSQLGSANEDINVVAREEGSGTRAAFEEMVMGEELITATAILQPSNGALRTTVAGDPNAMGFLSFGYIDSSTKALSIDGIAATVDNAKNGTYPIVRPLLLLTKGQPEGVVKEFINFCLGPEGQEIVAKDYIPVN
jgi:phosphate transport system substrate-binding protein